MKKQTIKSISFVFLMHVLSVINMLLCMHDWLVDTASLIVQIILCIIAVPTYFGVKNEPPRKWLYTLTSFVAHIVFTILTCFVLGRIFNGWDNAIIYWTEILLSSAFGIVFIIDLIVNIRS